MKERIDAQKPSFITLNEIFACRLPGRVINEIGFDDLPSKIRSDIGSKKDCGISYQIIHPDNSSTFVGESSTFEIIHLQDRNIRNRYAGEGHVYIENVEDELYIPVVGFSFTSKEFRRRGLGKRRLTLMNAMTKTLYDESLHSSVSPRIAQKAVWERLVEEELAETHEFKGIRRYKFI